MFGLLRVDVLDDDKLMTSPEEERLDRDAPIKKLLQRSETAVIGERIDFPQRAVVLFLLIPDNPRSGAIYVYLIQQRFWVSVDFADATIEGYSLEQFKDLIRNHYFLDLVQNPSRLLSKRNWVVRRGTRPIQPFPELSKAKLQQMWSSVAVKSRKYEERNSCS